MSEMFRLSRWVVLVAAVLLAALPSVAAGQSSDVHVDVDTAPSGTDDTLLGKYVDFTLQILTRIEASNARTDALVRWVVVVLSSLFAVGAGGGIASFFITRKTARDLSKQRENLRTTEKELEELTASIEQLRADIQECDGELETVRAATGIYDEMLVVSEVEHTAVDLLSPDEVVLEIAVQGLLERSTSPWKLVRYKVIEAFETAGVMPHEAVERLTDMAQTDSDTAIRRVAERALSEWKGTTA